MSGAVYFFWPYATSWPRVFEFWLSAVVTVCVFVLLFTEADIHMMFEFHVAMMNSAISNAVCTVYA